jgi:hypothetical protein
MQLFITIYKNAVFDVFLTGKSLFRRTDPIQAFATIAFLFLPKAAVSRACPDVLRVMLRLRSIRRNSLQEVKHLFF